MHRANLLPLYQALYLSPHLDDAALSCGGQIYERTQAGDAVLVVTIMAGDPPQSAVSAYAAGLHRRWQLAADATAVRRREDIVACKILGAREHHLSIPDCIYRGDASGPYYQADAEIFGDIHPQELALVARLARLFVELPAAEQVFAPLGVGHHVDHLLVRAAAEIVWGETNLAYYEDYPYAEQAGIADALTRDGDWRKETVAISQAALAAKRAAIMAYQSQLSTFFADDAELSARINHFAAQRGGECLWFQSTAKACTT